MSRTNDYPPRRYYTMQAVMWLIFAASLGAAAITTRTRSGPVALQTLTVQLPQRWSVEQVTTNQVIATEGGNPRRSRMITVTERVRSAPLVDWIRGAPQGEPLAIGPMQGVLSAHPNFDGTISLRATALLSGGNIVKIELRTSRNRDGRVADGDIALVQQVAASVKVLDDPNEVVPQVRRR